MVSRNPDHPRRTVPPRLTREERLEKLLLLAAALLAEELDLREDMLRLPDGSLDQRDEEVLKEMLLLRTLLAQIRAETARPGGWWWQMVCVRG